MHLTRLFQREAIGRVLYSHSPMPTQIHALDARQSAWLDFIQPISLQKARSFSRFHYLAMLKLYSLAYTMNTL